MKRARIGMIATVVLAVATVAFAQAKPDFSGPGRRSPQPRRRQARRRRTGLAVAAVAGAAAAR